MTLKEAAKLFVEKNHPFEIGDEVKQVTESPFKFNLNEKLSGKLEQMESMYALAKAVSPEKAEQLREKIEQAKELAAQSDKFRYKYPGENQTAIVLDYVDNQRKDDGSGYPYENECMIILVEIDGCFLRYAVDPIFFELV